MSVERVKVNQYVPFSVIESYFLKGSFYKTFSEVKKKRGKIQEMQACWKAQRLLGNTGYSRMKGAER